ncbi:MAG: hypothetical protein HY659_08110 [Rhizobiales bacterium]|nr:hypothetical protein [Hyphomicrobiales bacterium]
MTTSLDRVGFQTPGSRTQKKRRLACAELIMSAALVLSIAVAATAVSIGIARADALGATASDDNPIALAALIGFIIAGMGGLTAIVTAGGESAHQHD